MFGIIILNGNGDICVSIHLASRSLYADSKFAITYFIIVLFANYPCGELHIYNEDRLSRAAKLQTHNTVSGLYLSTVSSLSSLCCLSPSVRANRSYCASFKAAVFLADIT